MGFNQSNGMEPIGPSISINNPTNKQDSSRFRVKTGPCSTIRIAQHDPRRQEMVEHIYDARGPQMLVIKDGFCQMFALNVGLYIADWLVVWLPSILFSHSSWECLIIPIDEV